MGIKKLYRQFKDEIGFLEGINAKNKFFSNHRTFTSRKTAIMEFERSKAKLFNVINWSRLPGINSAFQIYDRKGIQLLDEKIAEGNFIFIDLPGPDPANWVQVIDTSEKRNSAEFTVRPCADPMATGDKIKEIQHFFTDKATSNFKIERIGNSIYGYEIGKQEEINNKGIKAGNRKIINTIIAESGSLGLQKMQWDKLTNYLVHNIEIEG